MGRAMRRAYSYIRMSTLEQLKGISLRRQLAKSKAYCEKHGLILDETFKLQDIGLSAYNGENVEKGALACFLEALRMGKIPKGSVLVVESLDRLSREQPRKALRLFLEILENGISIVTIFNEKEYRPDSTDEFDLFMAIVEMARSHQESLMKSSRHLDNWKAKRENIGEKKLTAQIPAWLSARADRSGFDLKPESVAIVKRIYQMAIDGVGVGLITKRLNEEQVHNFGDRSKSGWHRSYILKILRNRAVLGEFQAHIMEGKKRKPVGEVLPDYFPRIIGEAIFYKAQQALESRRSMCGPKGSGISNLFTGLIKDARDKLPMNISHKGSKGSKGSRKRIVSSGAIRAVKGSTYMSFHYELLEKAFLTMVKELSPGDLFPSAVQDKKAERRDYFVGQLEVIGHKLTHAKRMADQKPDVQSYWDMIADYEAQLKRVSAELETLKRESTTSESETLTETKTLVELMDSATGQGREDLRAKVRQKIRLLVKSIWVCVWTDKARWEPKHNREKTFRFCEVQVHFDGGSVRSIYCEEKSGMIFGNDQPVKKHVLDLSKYGGWYETGWDPADKVSTSNLIKAGCLMAAIVKMREDRGYPRLTEEEME